MSDTTLRIYEVNPLAVKNDDKRTQIADYYRRLRTFVGPKAA
ncbi:hypothetical protein AKJ09_03674 [Labilithrix luteola]|uniref:Uncharacterized protein n=1 Tax=Labilithrix luteola TaxID=1391654 RepID=A0A0K1PTZ9_9BACT|nr:hypothetical protein [Labilithrix luteola]AKU97010.1 hypothetical protein AKJ09_03674 [Labilithrix luteola]